MLEYFLYTYVPFVHPCSICTPQVILVYLLCTRRISLLLCIYDIHSDLSYSCHILQHPSSRWFLSLCRANVSALSKMKVYPGYSLNMLAILSAFWNAVCASGSVRKSRFMYAVGVGTIWLRPSSIISEINLSLTSTCLRLA